MNIRNLFASLCIAGLAACAGCSERSSVYEYNFLALGTLVKVSIYTDDEASATAAVDLLEQDLAFLDANFYPDRGLLGQVNTQLRDNGIAVMDPAVAPLIERGAELERISRGLFNPALGELVALWGFLQDERPAGLPPPLADEISAVLRQRPAMARLTIAGSELKSGSRLILDFGGFAKGYALEQGVARLRGSGVENAIINAGGDISIMGQPGDRAWRIGIRSPGGPGVLGGIEMRSGETIVTSGDYERFFEYDGEFFHHILDPRDGYPAAHTRSVTVIHNDAVLADAAATALFVAGPSGLIGTATDMGVRYFMLVDREQHIHLSREMSERFVPAGHDHELHIIELP